MSTFFSDYPVKGGGVTSLNGLTGALTLVGAGGITITPSGTTITITGTGGTVTSVGLADGSTTPIYTITGSPVTSTGTLTFSLSAQTANTVFAGPTTGAAAQPTFRPLVSADIPDLSGLYANITLSNLAGTTSINSSLIPLSTSTYTIGNGNDIWNGVFTSLVQGANGGGSLTLQTGLQTTGSGSVSIITGQSSSGSSGAISLSTGVSSANSGNITLTTGNASGTQGAIQLQNGTQGVSGYIWTSIDTVGSGAWVNGSGVFIPLSQKGAANGVATLDASSKIPASQLPSVVMEYQGAWNPTTNTPTLSDGTGINGYVYYVTALFAGPVAGLTDPSMVNFQIGDLVIYSSAIGKWQLVTPAAGVSSVNGAQGAVTVNAINQLTGDATAGPASGSQSEALTLATVNSNVGSFTNANITVNAKGLVTAASSGTNGTVTSVSVVSANGLAGTVATATSTPAITLSTTIIGLLKGDGTAISAATAGTDYVIPSGSITGTASNITATSNSTLTTITALSLPTTQLTGTLQAAQFPALTGDVTTTTGSLATTLATVNANVGTFGSATQSAVITVNAKGLVTAVSNATITVSQATNLSGGAAGEVVYQSAANTTGFTAAGTSGQVLQSNGTSAPSFVSIPGNTTVLKAPTIQKFTSSSGTYTTPSSPAPLYIQVEMVGGGGGGGGSGTGTTGGTGGTGGNTTFQVTAGPSLLVANGGTGGSGSQQGGGGAGGTASLGSGPVGTALTGGGGYEGVFTSAVDINGGNGAPSPFGGAGAALTAAAGGSAVSNTGSGAAGGGTGASSGSTGSGGAAGGYVKALISAPAATYTYAVGAGGTAGAAGSGSFLAGGVGGSGVIIVTEYYQ